MGILVFVAILLLILFKINSTHSTEKLKWFLIGIVFFPTNIVIIQKPLITFPRFVVIVMILTLILENKFRSSVRNFPIKRGLIFLCVSIFITGIFDARLDIFLKIYRPSIYFFESFFPICIAYSLICSMSEVIKIYKFLFNIFCIFSLYGLVNFLLKYNFYTDYISKLYNNIDFGNRYTLIGDDRFRISSFSFHPLYYGLQISIIIMIFVVFLSLKIKIYRNLIISLIFLGLIAVNLIWTNSRTPLFALFSGLIIYIIFGLNSIRKIQAVGMLLITGVILINFAEVKIVNEVLKIFTSDVTTLEGSSVEMRKGQMEASLVIFLKKPITGNGLGYITENLGYSTDSDERKSDKELFGFESYMYKLLIEQGCVGLIGVIMYFYSMIIFFIRIRKKVDPLGKKLTILGISTLTIFLLFIFGTGDLGSFTFFSTLIGINLKAVDLSRNNMTTL